MTDVGARPGEAGGQAFGATIRVDIPPPVQPPVLIEDPSRGGWIMEAPDIATAIDIATTKLAQADRDQADAADRQQHWAAVLAALKAAG